MRLVTSAVTLFLCIVTSQAKELRPNQVDDVSRAYGFMVGQNLALDQIERLFPQLRHDVRAARLRFTAKFGDMEAILAAPLKGVLKDKFLAMDAALRAKISESNNTELYRSDAAQNILKIVNDRANGQIPDDYLKPMLIVKYDGDQLKEFSDGWRQVFTSGSEQKARGVKIHIELPKIFGSKESPRPHILRNWTSENGTGFQTIILDVRDAGKTVQQEDIDDDLVKDLSRNFAGPAGELIESGRFRHETYPGIWFAVAREEERAAVKIKLGMLYYMIFAGDRAVSVGCSSGGGLQPNFDARKAAADLKPLCLRVLNTLVLPGAYQ